MTREEQLAYCDCLDARLSALNAHAAAFVTRSYATPPMLVHANVWSIPHPHERAPLEWGRVIAASVAAGVSIGCFAVIIAMSK